MLNFELRLYLIKGSNAIIAINLIRGGQVRSNKTISFSDYFIQIYYELNRYVVVKVVNVTLTCHMFIYISGMLFV